MGTGDPDYDVPCDEACDAYKDAITSLREFDYLPVPMTTLASVTGEICHARAKHGDGYMGELAKTPDCTPIGMLAAIAALGEAAHDRIEEGQPTPMLVLMDEVGELALDLINSRDIDARTELTQVAAMALAWLEAIT